MKLLKCKKCGYKAVRASKDHDCPLCLICERCKKIVHKCTCIEGE